MSIWVQVSAGLGNVPKECCWVVTRVAGEIEREATAAAAELLWIEPNSDDVGEINRSVLFSLEEEHVPSWLRPYLGTIQWIGQSPFDPNKKRKNWYVSVDILDQPSTSIYDWSKVRYETFRASGPGGQNVNKVSSAVRAIYNDVSAEAQDQRSQQQNRSIALERLKRRLQSKEDQKQTVAKQELWSMHSQLERGNPVRIYQGPKFQLKK